MDIFDLKDNFTDCYSLIGMSDSIEFIIQPVLTRKYLDDWIENSQNIDIYEMIKLCSNKRMIKDEQENNHTKTKKQGKINPHFKLNSSTLLNEFFQFSGSGGLNHHHHNNSSNSYHLQTKKYIRKVVLRVVESNTDGTK